MPRNADVELSLATAATDGYTQAKDQNDNPINYWYQFSGGDDRNGNVTASQERDEVSVVISLKGASNGAYDIDNAHYKSDSTHATDFTFEPVTSNKVTVKDSAITNKIEIDYTVVVTPKQSNTQIFCDPRIRNNW